MGEDADGGWVVGYKADEVSGFVDGSEKMAEGDGWTDGSIGFLELN